MEQGCLSWKVLKTMKSVSEELGRRNKEQGGEKSKSELWGKKMVTALCLGIY